MKRKVELPTMEPVYSTYNHLGSGSAALAMNPSIRNWYLNEVMILSCTKKFLKGYTSPQINLHKGTHHSNPYLEKVRYPLRYAKGYIHYIIKELINNGFYVCFSGIDDYYIKGKSWYRERHFPHDGMICGYDDFEKTYCVCAYDSDWLYKRFYISQKDFEKGRKAAFKAGFYGMVFGIKPKKEEVAFDVDKILTTLNEYLYTEEGTEPTTGEPLFCGIIVHDYIALYVRKLIDGAVPYERMDKRVFRLIWEHKKVMEERLKKTEDFLGLGNEISEEYRGVVTDADMIRMLYASHHMKRRDSLLPVILNKLLTIKEKEEKLLTEFLDKATKANERRKSGESAKKTGIEN